MMKEENEAIIKALNIYGRVPETYELLNEIERLNNKIKEQSLLLIEFQDMEQRLKEKDNIIDELKNWFKGYHKSQSHLSWYEEDYIEFIEHLEKELKGSDEE